MGLQIYKISYSVYIFFLYRQNDSSGCNSDAEEVSGSKGMIKTVADITLFKEFQATFIGSFLGKILEKKILGDFRVHVPIMYSLNVFFKVNGASNDTVVECFILKRPVM